MQSLIELAVTGTEQDIRAFAARVAVEGSRVGPIASKASQKARTAMGNLWAWDTGLKKVPADAHAEDVLPDFLKTHSHLIPVISELSDQIVDVIVTIVSEYKDHEFASGYSIDADTISLLNQFRATLEIDIVRQLT